MIYSNHSITYGFCWSLPNNESKPLRSTSEYVISMKNKKLTSSSRLAVDVVQVVQPDHHGHKAHEQESNDECQGEMAVAINAVAHG